MIDIPGTEIQKYLRILVFQRKSFCQCVVNGLVKSNRDKICRLNILLCINDRISKRDIQIPDRRNGKHIGSNKLIRHPVLSFIIIIKIIASRVRHIRNQPTMEILHFEPLCRFQMQRKHRKRRRTSRQNIRTMIIITPNHIIFYQTH